MTPLEAFTLCNFDWTLSLSGVWRDFPFDVSDLHARTMEDILDIVRRLEDDEALVENPLGRVVVGEAGAGKTHFLGQLRRRVIEMGGTFLLADLTDVRDFWETTLQGAVTSLTRPLPLGSTQLERLVDALLARFGEGPLRGLTAAQFKRIRPPALSNRVDTLLKAVARGTNSHEAARHDPVLRALMLLGSDEQALVGLGEAWLDVREEAMMVHDLPSTSFPAKARLAGLAWAAQHWGPTVIAVDQLDAIASEARAGDGLDDSSPNQIFMQATNGLMALRDVMPRTLVVISCLEGNWEFIETEALAPVKGRFSDPLLLKRPSGAQLDALIAQRLAVAYRKADFRPPYPTYPFHASCFEGVRLSPRQLLRRAETHRMRCRELGRVEELERFEDARAPISLPTKGLGRLDEAFSTLRAKVDPEAKLRGADPELDRLLETACRALALENPVADRHDVELDLDFGRAGRVEPLHARIRVVDREDGDRERHLSFRFVQQDHHIAFQTRVRKAMTESGVDRKLAFRRLVLLRSGETPSTPKSRALLRALMDSGGYLAQPSLDEVRSLAALTRLFEAPPEGFEAWLAERRPVSQLPVFASHLDYLFGGSGVPEPIAAPEAKEVNVPPIPLEPTAALGPVHARSPALTSPKAATPPSAASPARAPGGNNQASATLPERIPLGRLAGGIGMTGRVWLPPNDLRKHAVITGAPGSGKTVLLKRVVEEAALRGIPAIVVDVANDLARLDERPDEHPSGFDADDRASAARYFENVEVVVWTPGRQSGNPLNADPIPDFGPVLDDPDELQAAIQMSVQLLAADLGLKGANANISTAILTDAIRAFARGGGRGIEDLQRLLDEPAGLGAHYANGEKAVAKMADLLRAARTTNPLLGASGARLDIDALFGRRSKKTRISVVNLSGLASLEQMQAFVGRLTTLLFTYAKAKPARENEMAGLFVLDEAKDFAPSQSKVASSEPLRRAGAQLRKYGYGMVLATQMPKSIDNQIVGTCGTQVFGRALAPAVQAAAREMMDQLGGAPGQVGTLKAGEFYVSVPAESRPRKVKTSMCFSFHGPAPSPEEVRIKAERHRSITT